MKYEFWFTKDGRCFRIPTVRSQYLEDALTEGYKAHDNLWRYLGGVISKNKLANWGGKYYKSLQNSLDKSEQITTPKHPRFQDLRKEFPSGVFVQVFGLNDDSGKLMRCSVGSTTAVKLRKEIKQRNSRAIGYAKVLKNGDLGSRYKI